MAPEVGEDKLMRDPCIISGPDGKFHGQPARTGQPQLPAHHRADGISSDLEQGEREEVLRNFRNKKTQIMVATDILSRGIDIEGIDLVLNFDVPNDAEDYVHRIGRTARAQRSGVAITFITEKDQHDFKKIENLIEREVTKVPVPPALGESPVYNPKDFKGRGRGQGKPYRKGGKGGGKRPGGNNRKPGNSTGKQ